jgi:periplasmic divalent cation tolerance protein
MSESDFSLVYVTTSDVAEATAIGRMVVEERLAACANVIPGMSSIYWWDNAVQTGHEAMLILKTRSALLNSLVERVASLHSYDTPCIIALPITGGSNRFLAWIDGETNGLPK